MQSSPALSSLATQSIQVPMQSSTPLSTSSAQPPPMPSTTPQATLPTQISAQPQMSPYYVQYPQYILPPGYAPLPSDYYPIPFHDNTEPDKVKKDRTMIVAILIIIGVAILAFIIGFIIIWYRWFNYPST